MVLKKNKAGVIKWLPLKVCQGIFYIGKVKGVCVCGWVGGGA